MSEAKLADLFGKSGCGVLEALPEMDTDLVVQKVEEMIEAGTDGLVIFKGNLEASFTDNAAPLDYNGSPLEDFLFKVTELADDGQNFTVSPKDRLIEVSCC